MNPAGILKNAATGRYHPIVFRYAPPPSGDLSGGVGRYKSRGHHTAGFETLDEATSFITAQPNWKQTGLVWEWSGEGVPAIVEWFSNDQARVDSSS